MRAGTLRHKIRFDSRTESQTSDGQVTITWSEFATVRASIEQFQGREFFDARAVNEEYTVRIRLRYLPNIDTDMRIVDTVTGDIYDIKAISNLERRNKELEIIATNLNDEST